MKKSGFGRLVALSLCGVSSLLSACGGRSDVNLEGAPVAAGGTGGAGGIGGAGGAGTGGEGGAPLCEILSDGFSMQLDAPGFTHWGCGLPMGTAQGDLMVDARVVKSEFGNMVLDACGPTGDCVAILYYLTLTSGPAMAEIPLHTFVRMRVNIFDTFFGCEQTISIINLPSWGGDPNPTTEGERLWLAASDGATTTLEGSPFTVERVKLDCNLGGNMGCGIPAAYELRFTPVNAPDAAIEVPMGQPKSLSLPGTPALTAYNFRSFETGYCDDYWNWGYWVSQPPS